jgi:uncharacterized protein YhjY with autotransporter beta-barrel domain
LCASGMRWWKSTRSSLGIAMPSRYAQWKKWNDLEWIYGILHRVHMY